MLHQRIRERQRTDPVYLEHCRAKSRAIALRWQKRHPYEKRLANREYRRRLGRTPSGVRLTEDEVKALIRAAKGRCVYCGRFVKHLTIDHVTPVAKGGLTILGNVVMACRSCNAKKGTKAPLRPVQPYLCIV
jgi:5-methylcytosine-specific restriction endonuclease McrA